MDFGWPKLSEQPRNLSVSHSALSKVRFRDCMVGPECEHDSGDGTSLSLSEGSWFRLAIESFADSGWPSAGRWNMGIYTGTFAYDTQRACREQRVILQIGFTTMRVG